MELMSSIVQTVKPTQVAVEVGGAVNFTRRVPSTWSIVICHIHNTFT